MKKFSVLIALALLAVAGTGYAVTCAYDNVPAATLLVPHFRVSRNGSTGADIAAQGVDTLCSITNVSATGLIAHVTVWNKYSKAVLDFNVPLTAYDVATFSMRAVLNGRLNVNGTLTQYPAVSFQKDVCGINQSNIQSYTPKVGFGPTTYIRFSNPDTRDRQQAISAYAEPAFFGSFRQRVWDSLDETQDITTFTTPTGAGILDTDNPGCGLGSQNGDGTLSGDFGGYVTIDVVNYCTNYFPEDYQFYRNDAIATAGWAPTYTPNALMGDVFYIDPTTNGGNISGDPMVALEYDSRLNDWNAHLTFYGRYAVIFTGVTADSLTPIDPIAAPYVFIGDGREPLGNRYGFRYLADATNGLQSWAVIYRTDNYNTFNSDGTVANPPVYSEVNLCNWMALGGPRGAGFYDTVHQLNPLLKTYDLDENVNTPSGGGPSGGGTASTNYYVFLESQRIALVGSDYNQGSFKAGWIDMTLPGVTFAANGGPSFHRYQAYVGIQHTAPGAFVSVGHSATLLNEQFLCDPVLTGFPAGNTP